MSHTILRLPSVKARTGLSRSTIYLRISQGGFPKPISLGGRAVGWVEDEVNEWLDERIQARRDCTHKTGSGVG
jgi:prophage regulatory protein